MQLLPGQQKPTQFLGVVIVVGLLLISSGQSQTNERKDDNRSSVDGDQPKPKESTVKKALNEVAPPLPPADIMLLAEKGEKLEPVVETSATDAVLAKKQTKAEQRNDVVTPTQEATKKTDINKSQTATDNKTSTVAHQTASTAAPSSSSSYLYHHDESILNSDEEISDSLKPGFYLLVALSLSAVSFIVFKVYRLRLSRAERKYGVQGDRSTQELTPLPIAIDDGPSDDEDQTLFEVQRQHIRIL